MYQNTSSWHRKLSSGYTTHFLVFWKLLICFRKRWKAYKIFRYHYFLNFQKTFVISSLQCSFYLFKRFVGSALLCIAVKIHYETFMLRTDSTILNFYFHVILVYMENLFKQAVNEHYQSVLRVIIKMRIWFTYIFQCFQWFLKVVGCS